MSRASVRTSPARFPALGGCMLAHDMLAHDTAQATKPDSTAFWNSLLPFLVMVLKPFLRRNVSVKSCTGFFNSSESSPYVAFLMSFLHIMLHCTVSNIIWSWPNRFEILFYVYHLALDRHECFQCFHLKRTNNANNATHHVKLGKERQKSSKRNHYIISPRVIIKAIIIMLGIGVPLE